MATHTATFVAKPFGMVVNNHPSGGTVITSVEPGGAAERLGVQPRSIVLTVNSHSVPDRESLLKLLGEIEPPITFEMILDEPTAQQQQGFVPCSRCRKMLGFPIGAQCIQCPACFGLTTPSGLPAQQSFLPMHMQPSFLPKPEEKKKVILLSKEEEGVELKTVVRCEACGSALIAPAGGGDAMVCSCGKRVNVGDGTVLPELIGVKCPRCFLQTNVVSSVQRFSCSACGMLVGVPKLPKEEAEPPPVEKEEAKAEEEPDQDEEEEEETQSLLGH